MTAVLNFGRDINSYNAYAPAPSTLIYSATLTNSNATSITLPSDHPFYIVAFSYTPGASVFVDFSGNTAAIPAHATLTATTSTLIPGSRTLAAGSTISVITDNTTADITIEIYAVSYP
ncbi:MAG: hypothetical protein EPO02_12755 [Nitrospirae bacterium]|nr:MAG: hypothetical protein EPO02_12755 [Nitrospirota bacterium]